MKPSELVSQSKKTYSILDLRKIGKAMSPSQLTSINLLFNAFHKKPSETNAEENHDEITPSAP